MSNLVQNNIVIQGDAVQLKGLGERLRKDGLKFEDYIPIPPSLRLDESSVTDDALVYAISKKHGTQVEYIPLKLLRIIDGYGFSGIIDRYGELQPNAQLGWNKRLKRAERRGKIAVIPPKPPFEYPKNFTEDERNDTEFAKIGYTAYHNLFNYGHKTWFDWCYAKWGTKWDADNVAFDIQSDFIQIIFHTANGCPDGVLGAITEAYPGLSITGVFADEDIGSNCGRIFASDGHCKLDVMTRCEDSIRFACEVWGYDPEEYLNDEYEDESIEWPKY